jgi:transcription termination factor NusB
MSSSPRRRAREFALQGLYQWLLSGNDPAAIRGQLAESAGFARCDNKLFDRLWQGVTTEYDALQSAYALFSSVSAAKSRLWNRAFSPSVRGSCSMRLTCHSR